MARLTFVRSDAQAEHLGETLDDVIVAVDGDVQLTYNTLRDENGTALGHLDEDGGWYRVHGRNYNEGPFSDVVIEASA